MIVINRDKVVESTTIVLATKEERSRLGRLAEEMSIPWKELNKVAKEVVGREFGDCSRLTPTENRKVIRYLKQNYDELSKRYRKLLWS